MYVFPNNTLKMSNNVIHHTSSPNKKHDYISKDKEKELVLFIYNNKIRIKNSKKTQHDKLAKNYIILYCKESHYSL